jgi:hypothetical protein
MRVIDNVADWIKDEWIEEILSTPGMSVPRDLFVNNQMLSEIDKGERDQMHPTERAIYETYGTDGIHFQLLEDGLLSFDIDPPWITDELFEWWVTKMYPGQYIPVHKDNLRGGDINTKRYWIPLSDYDPGHIFLYEDTIVTKYKKGDLYLYDEAQAWHGAINLGSTPRIILQVSTYHTKYRNR